MGIDLYLFGVQAYVMLYDPDDDPFTGPSATGTASEELSDEALAEQEISPRDSTAGDQPKQDANEKVPLLSTTEKGSEHVDHLGDLGAAGVSAKLQHGRVSPPPPDSPSTNRSTASVVSSTAGVDFRVSTVSTASAGPLDLSTLLPPPQNLPPVTQQSLQIPAFARQPSPDPPDQDSNRSIASNQSFASVPPELYQA